MERGALPHSELLRNRRHLRNLRNLRLVFFPHPGLGASLAHTEGEGSKA